MSAASRLTLAAPAAAEALTAALTASSVPVCGWKYSNVFPLTVAFQLATVQTGKVCRMLTCQGRVRPQSPLQGRMLYG